MYMNFENIFNEANASKTVENTEQKLEETASPKAEKLQEATFYATCVNDNGLSFKGNKDISDKTDIDSFVSGLNF